MAARSVKPSVWIEPYRSAGGFKRWRVRREKDGRRMPDLYRGSDHALAVEIRDKERARLWKRRLRLDADTATMTLSQYMEHDRARREGRAGRTPRVAPNTVYNDQRALGLLKESAGDVDLSSIDRTSIEDLEALLEERGYHVNAILIFLRALKAALRRALKEDPPLLDRDPFFGYKMPASVDVAHPPSPDELAGMWAHLPHVAKCAVTVAGENGLRRGEVFNITRASIERRKDEPWMLTVQKSKTRRGRVEYKTMTLPPASQAALESLEPWPADGPIFKFHPTTLSSWVTKARRKAGLGRIRLHDFRHLWATEFMQQETDEYSLMQAGGWTSRAAVARYQHATTRRREANARVRVNLPPILPPKRGRRK